MGFWDLFRRKRAVNAEVNGSAPFVISLDGELYSDTSGRVTDIELAGGAKEVLGAGRWVVAQGKVLVLTNESPTYRPSLEQMQMTVKHLAEIGMDLSGDENGLLIIVYSEVDKDGQGSGGKQYRVRISPDGTEMIPEDAHSE